VPTEYTTLIYIWSTCNQVKVVGWLGH